MSGSRYGESWTCATCGKQVLGEGPWGISPAIARHVADLQEIGKGVEADQATIARLTAERDNALADADNDRSLAASRQREVARLSEELAQADAVIAREWQNNSAAHDPRDDATIVAAIERHRARAALSPLPTQDGVR